MVDNQPADKLVEGRGLAHWQPCCSVSELAWPLGGALIWGLHVPEPWERRGTDTVCSKTINPDCEVCHGWTSQGSDWRPAGQKTRHRESKEKPQSQASVSGFPGDQSRATAASVRVSWPFGSWFTTALPPCDLFFLQYLLGDIMRKATSGALFPPTTNTQAGASDPSPPCTKDAIPATNDTFW